MKVIKIKLPFSNAYLLIGERPVLVDSGSPGNQQAILHAMQQVGVAPDQLALILHTHAHFDHAGTSVFFHERSGAPVAVHPADAQQLAGGVNGPIRASRWSSHLIKLLVGSGYPGIAADVLLEDGQRLDAYGIAGRVISTPGHTAGSVSVLLDNGEAVIGDVMMGGSMGGAFLPALPRYHYFINDLPALHNSMRRLMNEASLHTLYVGHGGPLRMDHVRRKFSTRIA